MAIMPWKLARLSSELYPCTFFSKQSFWPAQNNTSSFCVRVQSIFMLLGITNLDKLTMRAVDIKAAYIHAIVKSNIYGRMSKKPVPYLLRLYPHLFNLINRDGSITFRVLKAVYGVAEASRLWFLHLAELLSKLGYKTSTIDHSRWSCPYTC